VTKLSTAARVIHDLGLAVCFGGAQFGKVAFNPSVGAIACKTERGRVGGTTWNRFNVLNVASFGAALLSWLPSRLGSAGKDANRRVHELILIKDVLTAVATTTGLAVLVAQVLLNRQAPEGAVPLETGACRPPRQTTGRPCSSGYSAPWGARTSCSSRASSRRLRSSRKRVYPRHASAREARPLFPYRPRATHFSVLQSRLEATRDRRSHLRGFYTPRGLDGHASLDEPGA
jgi:hypothetical protein